ncbi:CsbD family protein [Streptomyces halobius]|uniref:CsbD family protein n=1 Tax=Streptomyces halobius TaxID=2879846 RepID=A0ABY4LZF3_9ACTN|nr:CsbD family protein [Streptomyces halobius]UQA90855.1 CsbD family protein [Streptomyces halobius]
MGIGKKTRNIGQIIEGKAKETVGKAVGNKGLERKGRTEQIRGRVKQAAEKGMHTFKR